MHTGVSDVGLPLISPQKGFYAVHEVRPGSCVQWSIPPLGLKDCLTGSRRWNHLGTVLSCGYSLGFSPHSGYLRCQFDLCGSYTEGPGSCSSRSSKADQALPPAFHCGFLCQEEGNISAPSQPTPWLSRTVSRKHAKLLCWIQSLSSAA